ncbi:MAG: hypothetical protein ABIV63_20975 [Caldimonas sp.]
MRVILKPSDRSMFFGEFLQVVPRRVAYPMKDQMSGTAMSEMNLQSERRLVDRDAVEALTPEVFAVLELCGGVREGDKARALVPRGSDRRREASRRVADRAAATGKRDKPVKPAFVAKLLAAFLIPAIVVVSLRPRGT